MIDFETQKKIAEDVIVNIMKFGLTWYNMVQEQVASTVQSQQETYLIMLRTFYKQKLYEFR